MKSKNDRVIRSWSRNGLSGRLPALQHREVTASKHFPRFSQIFLIINTTITTINTTINITIINTTTNNIIIIIDRPPDF